MAFSINSNINLVSNGENPTTNSLIAELSIYPIQTEMQRVSNLTYISDPTAVVQLTSDKIIYQWNEVSNSVKMGLTANIHVKNEVPKIDKKIPFPIQNINYTFLPYTQPAEYIDLNDDIKNQANELVSGEDDLYSAVYKLADWTAKNVQYNLSTLTAEAVQKSSWVFVNKRGVCDEITNLFISMCRSVGVPARFVSGVVYSNIDDKWGNHGWAEVYFPNYGWIPFDVTYQQYGWIDPSHIILDYSVDSVTPSLTLSGSMHNSQFGDTKLNIYTNLVAKSEQRSDLVNMDLEVLTNKVGPGSYVPIRVKVENLAPYYVPLQVKVRKAPALTEDNIKTVLLKSNQEKSLFWILKIPEDINENYLYTTIFEVIDSFGNLESAKIEYSKDYDIFNLDEANKKIKEYQQIEQLTYSDNVNINCKPEKASYYDYETVSLICNVKNIGNSILNGLSVCIDNNCQMVTLSISESKNIKFENLDGNKQLEIKAYNDKINYQDFFTVKSLTDPNLRISNLEYPDLIVYNGIVDLKFNLNSDAPVKHIVFSLNGNEFYKLDSFSGEESMLISLPGKYFYSKDKSSIIISYEDENGYKYSSDKTFLTNVMGVPFYAKILSWFKNLF
ncbi:MAG: transglutaminase-like domain-containing protein [Candidatus Nanoarchaeia archaeon]|nr:transglutaminase-like domain-containing protein [Candidatus Nanoarchaeia archaeon]